MKIKPLIVMTNEVFNSSYNRYLKISKDILPILDILNFLVSRSITGIKKAMNSQSSKSVP